MELQINKDTISFRTITGQVASIQVFQQTWGSGGGGYVDPYYGGYVQAPTIHSQNWQRVRIDVGDREISADIPGDISLAAGDKIALVSAGSKAAKKWMWIGIANGKTRNVQTFGKPEDLFTLKSIGMSFGERFSSGLIMGLLGGGFIGFVILLAVFALIALVPTLSLIPVFGKANKEAIFMVSFFSTIGYLTVRGLKKAKVIDKRFEEMRNSALNEGLVSLRSEQQVIAEPQPA